MFKLVIKKTGKLQQEIILKDKSEFFIGRAQDCDVVLPAEHSISRKHLQLQRTEDGQWKITNLSQNNALIIDGSEITEGIIDSGQPFYVQNYEFCLFKVHSLEKQSSASSMDSKKNAAEMNLAGNEFAESTNQVDIPVYSDDVVTSPKKDSPTNDNNNLVDDPLNEPEANLVLANNTNISGVNSGDQTTIMNMSKGQNQLTAYLKVSIEEEAPLDIFKLEEDQSTWMIGRDETADVIIDSPNISRKHFKIKQKQGLYYIKDLKSSNGIILNDKKLTPGKYYPIQSSDGIFIVDTEIIFEVKNLALAKEVANMKLPTNKALVAHQQNTQQPYANLPGHYVPHPLPAHIPGAVMETPQENAPPSSSFLAKYKKRIFIYGAIAAVIGFFLLPNEKPSENVTKNEMVQDVELNSLTSEQQEYVKNAYHMGQQFYARKQFVNCQNEIKKIHQYVDTYQDSRKLGAACDQATMHERTLYDIEEKKKKAQQTDQFIQTVTSKCQNEFSTFKIKHELMSCLNPAIELSPADSRIQTLIDTFEFNEIQKQEKAQAIAARKAKIKTIRKKYLQAQALHKAGKIEQSISTYKNFIKISNYKELMEDKKQAGRELANVQESYHNKINYLNSQCAEQLSAGQFKKAYYMCEKAAQLIPEPRNKTALALMEKAKLTLQTKMKKYYEEASLNESTGHVSKAQEFWKNILNQDVHTGSYYEKAKIKMSKY